MLDWLQMRHPEDLDLGSKPAGGDLRYVQGFVNTVDIESGEDKLATTEGLAHWLEHHGLVPAGTRVSEADRDRAVALREALRALLHAHHGEPVDPEAVAMLDEAGRKAPLHLTFDERGEVRLEPGVKGVDGALARLVALIYRATLDGTWERLKVCRNDACRWAFYDASRNHSGSWCSMEVCGNRMKVRAHRQRHAT